MKLAIHCANLSWPGGPTALGPTLAARLKDPDEETATLAARALGEPFHDSAVPLLSSVAAAPDLVRLLEHVSTKALDALRALVAKQAAGGSGGAATPTAAVDGQVVAVMPLAAAAAIAASLALTVPPRGGKR